MITVVKFLVLVMVVWLLLNLINWISRWLTTLAKRNGSRLSHVRAKLATLEREANRDLGGTPKNQAGHFDEIRMSLLRDIYSLIATASKKERRAIAGILHQPLLKIITSQWEDRTLRMTAIDLLLKVDPTCESAINILEQVAHNRDESPIIRSRAEGVAGAIRGNIVDRDRKSGDQINRVII